MYDDNVIERERRKESKEISRTSIPDLIQKDTKIEKHTPSTHATNHSLLIETISDNMSITHVSL